MNLENVIENFNKDYQVAFMNSVTKTENMLKNSNTHLSEDNLKALYISFLKQNFSNSIGRYDLEKEARREGIQILINGKHVNFDSLEKWFSNIIQNQDNISPKNGNKSSKERTIEFATAHPVIALEIGAYKIGATNITTNSIRFATNELGLNENEEKEGSQVNAFRHVLWQATITKRYGIDIARKVGFAHEENPNALGNKYSPEDLKNIKFSSSIVADQTCDLIY